MITGGEKLLPADVPLLTAKPVFYVANVDDPEPVEQNPYVTALKELAEVEGTPVVVIAGKLEAEIAQLAEGGTEGIPTRTAARGFRP